MRLLYLSKHFPGPFHAIASYFAKQHHVTSLFLAERNTCVLPIPNIRRLSIPTLIQSRKCKNVSPAERLMVQALNRASHVANTLQGLQNDGFYPDIIYATPEDGYSLYVHDIFPKARIIIRANWFNKLDAQYTFFNQETPRQPIDFVLARLNNLLQFNLFTDAAFAISSSEWQKQQYPDELAKKITIVHDGVRTQFFKPVNKSDNSEIVVYSCQGTHPARGITTLCNSLPLLLRQRPHCQVWILSSQSSGAKKNDSSQIQTITHYIPELSPDEQARIRIFYAPKPHDYLRILQHCSVYVYLTAPFTLSAGLYEAMSCGACVIASDTGPVLDIIKHAENGFLCDFWNAEALAETVANVLERRAKFKYISYNAREYILEHHDFIKQHNKHVDLILQK